MNIPKKIKIGFVEYRVEIRDQKSEEASLGWCDPNTSKIILNPNQSKRMMFKTFIHECIHAIIYEYNVDLGSRNLGAQEDRNEYLARMMETGVAEVAEQLMKIT